MDSVKYTWSDGQNDHALALVYVQGTHGRPYSFGETGGRRVEIRDFLIGAVPVTQALWAHVMRADANPSVRRAPDLPLENVSWDDITSPRGFLDRINDGPVGAAIRAKAPLRNSVFWLPAETEWEYAARGGLHWSDGFRFSGSDDIDAVAWYDRRHGDHTQLVGLKAPNQLGIYDMSGNVWEWCRDVFIPDIESIPEDGTPFAGPGDERVLRGGCFHNRAIRCTVAKRYEIAHDYHDGCIGFRLVLATPGS